MADQAHVTSVEAIDQFRTQLILYVSKARPALEEVTSEILRLRLWLESDQRTTLEGLVRRRRKELDQAQSALSSARMAVIKHEATAEQLAVARARRALEEAEMKLKRVRYWDREFSTQVEPLGRQLEKLHTVYSNDLGRAIVHLARLVETLGVYADLLPTGQEPGSGSGSGPGPGAAGAAAVATPNPEEAP